METEISIWKDNKQESPFGKRVNECCKIFQQLRYVRQENWQNMIVLFPNVIRPTSRVSKAHLDRVSYNQNHLKVITAANQRRAKYHREPIRTKFKASKLSGKRGQVAIGFSFSFESDWLRGRIDGARFHGQRIQLPCFQKHSFRSSEFRGIFNVNSNYPIHSPSNHKSASGHPQ